MFYNKADTKQKNKNYAPIFNSITTKCTTLNKWRCFKTFTNTSISGRLFIRIWTLTTDFVLIQVNAGSNLRMFKFILPSLCESRLILLIYKKYGKSIVEIIPLQALQNTFEWIFNLSSEFPITWSFLFCWCILQWKIPHIFDKDLLLARNMVFCLKR